MSLRAVLAEPSLSPRPPTNLRGPLGSCCETQSQLHTASAALTPQRHPHRGSPLLDADALVWGTVAQRWGGAPGWKALSPA